MNMRILVTALALPILFACVPKPQSVILNPTPAVEAQEVGKKIRVRVIAADERPSAVLGFQRDAAGATVSTQGNPTEILTTRIIEGLRKKGFEAEAAEGEPGERTLTVSLTELSYAATSGGAVSGDVHLKAALTAAVAAGAGAPLERTYHAEQDRPVGLRPSTAAITRYTNELLSDVLSRLLNDERLLGYLAR